MATTSHRTTTKNRDRLLPQQALFFAKLLARKDGNATQAAIEAGYSPKSARSQASWLLKHPIIAKHLREASERVVEEAKVDAAWVLRELVELYSTDIADALDASGDLMTLKEMPARVRKMIQSIDIEAMYEGQGNARRLIGYAKKIRIYPRKDLLDQIGKHVSVNAYRENVAHTGIPSYEDELRKVQARIAEERAKELPEGK